MGVHHYPRIYGRSQFFPPAVALRGRFGRAAASVGSRGGAAMNVPMVDLRPMLAATEPAWRANLERLFDRMHFILGEQVAAFEEELATAFGAKFAVTVGSGTSAIELGLRGLWAWAAVTKCSCPRSPRPSRRRLCSRRDAGCASPTSMSSSY